MIYGKEYTFTKKEFGRKLKKALKGSREKWNPNLKFKDDNYIVVIEICQFCTEFATLDTYKVACSVCKKLFWGNVSKKSRYKVACLNGIVSKTSEDPTWKEDCKKMERKFKRIEKKYQLQLKG